MEKGVVTEKKSAPGRFGRGHAIALSVLAVWMTLFGSDKSPATRALQRFIAQRQPVAVTAAEIEAGFREAGTEAVGPVEMPAGAVTNELLRRRGGFDWAFRIEPNEEWRMENGEWGGGEWRVPWKGGFLTGVTVLARGEVRPDVGTLYYPVPFTNGVSLLPEARWGLLPNGGASVFSHAVTADGSLLLDWRNALVGRDPNAPTNLQMEIFSDGSFVWRTDGGSTEYAPVLPFDYDGDGLENSVDPEPLVPHPVDAHGTPAEWYRVVCSNVFTVAEDPNIPTFKNSNINSNAYYFVDVVAERGPAPIWFNADRDSRLGSPVVIARTGETNRVPLLIGVEYAVTSTVPISVSLPEDGYAEVLSSSDRTSTLKWPLEVDLVELLSDSSSRSFTVVVSPYDPGVTVVWDGGGSPVLGGAAFSILHFPFSILHFPVSPRSGGCTCVSGSGSSLVVNCVPAGACSGGCRANGAIALEGGLIPFSFDVCMCGREDGDSRPTVEPTAGPSEGSLSVSFSSPAVIYEDAYDNSPTDHVEKRSTETTLTVSVNGGPDGGRLTVSAPALGAKLERISGSPPPWTSVRIPAGTTVTYTATYRGLSPSEAEDDIVVSARFVPDGGEAISRTASATSVRVEFRAVNAALGNPCVNRHRYGVAEKVDCIWSPNSNLEDLICREFDQLSTNYEKTRFWCPWEGGNYDIQVSWGVVKFDIPISIVEPDIRCEACWWDGSVGSVGVAGQVRMDLRICVEPRDVSFEDLNMEEIPVVENGEYGAARLSGYFANTSIDTGARVHSRAAGAGVWHMIRKEQSLDYEYWTTDRVVTDVRPQPWSTGWKEWVVPIGWGLLGRQLMGKVKPDPRLIQRFTISESGEVSIEKFGHTIRRTVDNHVWLDGNRVN